MSIINSIINFIFITRVPEISEIWTTNFKQKDPWDDPYNRNLVVEILDVKDGWVKYSFIFGEVKVFGFSTQTINEFTKIYQPKSLTANKS